MELAVTVSASRKVKTGFLSSKVIPLGDVAQALIDAARDTPLEALCRARPSKFGARDGYLVTLYPPAGPFALIAVNDDVLLGATTSRAGPGYHAFIVSAVEKVQAKLGLKWVAQGQGDNTGYWRHHDFAGLRDAMAASFKATCRKVAAAVQEDDRDLSISLPKDATIALAPDEVITETGPRTRDEFRRWSELDGAALQSAAASYFPWWDAGFGGDFYAGLALHAIWMDLRWARPLDQPERNDLMTVTAWLNEAAQRGVRLPVPVEAVNEIRDLVASPNAPHFPRAEGIGYRRRSFLWKLDDDWTLEVPGSLGWTREPSGGLAFGNNVIGIHATAGVLDAAAAAAEKPLPVGEVAVDRGFYAADDGEGFTLDAIVRTAPAAGQQRACMIKIWMADETVRDIAEAVVDSVARATPGARPQAQAASEGPIMTTRPINRNWRLTMPQSLKQDAEDDDFAVATEGLDIRASVYDAPSDDPRIRAGEFDGEISLVEREIEDLGVTITVRMLGKTFPLGKRTSVCVMTITSTTPEMLLLGKSIGQSLTYVPDGQA